jgi:hypothetical protein
MAINFPDNPTVGQTLIQSNATWSWNGVAWDVLPSDTVSFDDLTVSSEAEIANLTLTGTLTGVGLNNLSDVSIESPINNQVLAYNQSLGTWSAATPAIFNGGTITDPLIISNNSATSSTDTGALQVAGGVGISGNVNVGSTVSADTAPTNAEHLTNKRYVDANVLAFSVAFGA